MNNKFDLVFEKAQAWLNEQEYINATFEDNIGSLVKILKDNDYLKQDKDVNQYVRDILSQPENVKEITLDTQRLQLPAMKLHVKQDSEDSESFSVTVIDLKDPEKQKEFQNSMLETIFDDVVNYIETIALQGLSPDKAVNELPSAEGGEAQPGAEGSELPTAENQPEAEGSELPPEETQETEEEPQG